MLQVCIHPGCFLRLVHADRANHFEPEVRDDSTPDLCRVLTRLQDVCHYRGEQDHYRFLRVRNRHLCCGRIIPGNVGCENSRYVIHDYGAVVLWTVVLGIYIYGLWALETQCDGPLPSPSPVSAYV